MSLYQSLREPPILTAVIGAECSDGIALVADTQLTRSVDKEFEFMDDEKIKADFEHFILGYAGTERTFEIFRKYSCRVIESRPITSKNSFTWAIPRARFPYFAAILGIPYTAQFSHINMHTPYAYT